MMALDGDGVNFRNHLELMQVCCPSVRGLAVYDRDLKLLWRDSGDGPGNDLLARRLQELRDGEETSLDVEFDDGRRIELVRMDDDCDELALALCLETNPGNDAPLVEQAPFVRLSEMLYGEYSQKIALASKEDELIHMTDELTRRYEELNLVYKAEDQALNIHHGRELLRQMVLNTSRFLNVDIIYLFISDKNVAMHKFRGDKPVLQSDALFECLRERVLPVIENGGEALVVNHVDEALRLGVEFDLPFKLVASPIVNVEGRVIGMLAIASQNFGVDFSNSDRNLLDVMAKKASKIAQSHFDPLTGLENSNSFELILQDMLKQSRGQQVQHALANVDIDRMAVINDISGRQAGDALIKRIGKTLADMVRARDVVARIGSDKFGVLLENCDLPTAKVVMKKISHAISSLDMDWEGESHEVSVSVGIAPVNSHTQTVASLLNAAETARNLGKERGRNSIHVLEIEDSNLLQRKEQMRWVSRIQAALRDGSFDLYAQLIDPLVAVADKPHYEILLRMRGKDGEVIPPGVFMPAAENFYLMSSIDHWVIDRALYELSLAGGKSTFCLLSINLSGQSLADPIGLGAYIGNKFEEYGVAPGDICFEITESAAIANIDDACLFIDQLHEMGCKFSLDDFGTGLSSFAYLKNLKVDFLKIDGSFVREVVDDPVSESIVAAVNQVGHAMRLQTVAEFVENDAIRQKLASLGVDYGQGYGIDKPAPFRDICLSPARTA